MSIWIVLAILAVMAALLIYAACCVDGDIDRQRETHPPKSPNGNSASGTGNPFQTGLCYQAMNSYSWMRNAKSWLLT